MPAAGLVTDVAATGAAVRPAAVGPAGTVARLALVRRVGPGGRLVAAPVGVVVGDGSGSTAAMVGGAGAYVSDDYMNTALMKALAPALPPPTNRQGPT
jgi:hypothetical protein